MSLLLSIIESPENCSVTESSKTFGEQGGTIGRAAENYWVLSDPECFLSSHHSKISYENGCYVLTDLSTNGTFLNSSREPIGKGNKVQLQDGDEIELSDYTFKVNLRDAEQISTDSPFPDETPFNEPFASQDMAFGDPFASGDISSIEPLLNSKPEETDPLAALDNVQHSFDSSAMNDVFTSNNSQSDQAGMMNQSVDWPTAQSETGDSFGAGSAVIPEDWDLNEDSAKAVNNDSGVIAQMPIPSVNLKAVEDQNRFSTLETENIQLQIENKKIQTLQAENTRLENELLKMKQQFIMLQKRKNASGNIDIDTTMITAMGLSNYDLSKEKIMEINQIVGEMIRETVTGMMQVLTARSSIKNEFRMNITTIQPVENNPLKFSANVDDALENMFLKKGSSYKKPIEALQDGFHGIAEHQVAILAGIRAAFKGAIERFEPYQLEARFERQAKGSFDVIPMLKKAKNWDQFIYYYNNLVEDMDNSFQYLFGDEFVQAYEDQLQRLIQARNSTK